MLLATLPPRGTDDFGSGAFEAPRGSKKHKGIDFACYPGTMIFSHTAGIVTKLGYAYKNDLSFRYVEVTDNDRLRHRYFYLNPLVAVGDPVKKGDLIGSNQNIADRYSVIKVKDGKLLSKVMRNHCHYEVLKRDNTPINPARFLHG